MHIFTIRPVATRLGGVSGLDRRGRLVPCRRADAGLVSGRRGERCGRSCAAVFRVGPRRDSAQRRFWRHRRDLRGLGSARRSAPASATRRAICSRRCCGPTAFRPDSATSGSRSMARVRHFVCTGSTPCCCRRTVGIALMRAATGRAAIVRESTRSSRRWSNGWRSRFSFLARRRCRKFTPNRCRSSLKRCAASTVAEVCANLPDCGCAELGRRAVCSPASENRHASRKIFFRAEKPPLTRFWAWPYSPPRHDERHMGGLTGQVVVDVNRCC